MNNKLCKDYKYFVDDSGRSTESYKCSHPKVFIRQCLVFGTLYNNTCISMRHNRSLCGEIGVFMKKVNYEQF